MTRYLPIGMIQGQVQEKKDTALVEGFEKSGMTQVEYCASKGISRSSLCYALRKTGRSKKTIRHRKDKKPRVSLKVQVDSEVMQRLEASNEIPSELINELLRKHFKIRKSNNI